MTPGSTRYNIKLSISHDYGEPSPHARTLVRLLPANLPDRQIVNARLLSVEPRPDERRDRSDFFGNVVTTLAFHRPIEGVELTLTARVERLAMPPTLDLSPTLTGFANDIADQPVLGAAAPIHHLWSSPRIPLDPTIRDFALAQTDPSETVLQMVHSLGQALHDDMEFDPDATNVDTPPAQAFAQRRGVCQDFTHIMISGLRSLGIPAGYVSGFLRTLPPPGKPRLEGADAMHAWVCAWCGGDVGWVEFDPTNACVVGLDHVAVAYGRDYSDVAPVKGSLRTAGAQASDQRVDVEPLN